MPEESRLLPKEPCLLPMKKDEQEEPRVLPEKDDEQEEPPGLPEKKATGLDISKAENLEMRKRELRV